MSRFRVLHVCTGNICRSPLADLLMREALADVPGVEVSSAGTGALVGYPISPHSGTLLRERGIDSSAFVARALTAEMVEAADLVLTATRRHRALVADTEPGAVPRTFTLREFARLTADVGLDELPAEMPERGTALVALAAARRGTRRPARPDDDDVRDPYGKEMPDYVVAAELIAEALDGPLRLLRGRAGHVG